MRGTEPIKIEEPFKDDDKVYYVNGGRCSGKVDKTINELVDYINKLQQENQSLKKENKILRENAEHNDKVVDKVNWENMLLKKENQELKKQLENKYEKVGTLTSELLYEENTKLLIQQKEFINYLEDEIKRINPKNLYISELNLRLDDIKFTQYLTYKEILQKYKSIIGVEDENNMGK